SLRFISLLDRSHRVRRGSAPTRRGVLLVWSRRFGARWRRRFSLRTWNIGPPDHIGSWRRLRQREDGSGKQQCVRKVVDPLHLDWGARFGEGNNQEGSIDDEDHQQNPTAETG